MAKSILDIVIRTLKQGSADKDLIKDLVNLKGVITNTAGAAGLLVGAGIAIQKGLNETVGTLVEYADKVRTVQNATGASAEDASKLIQILDDQKISYEQLSKAIAKSSKEYDFSIAGIAGMSDEYLTLTDTQKQAAFMQERFGKQWIDFVPIMQKGKQSILDMADGVSQNLILTQRAVDQAREYEIAMDTLGDSWEGLKITAGQTLIPAVNDVVNGFNVYIRAIEIAREEGLHFNEATDKAGYEIWQEQQALMANKEAVEANTESEKEAAAALKEASAARQSMLGLIGNIASETKNYADKQAELTLKMQENRAEADQLYPWQKQQLDELNAKYVDMQATYEQNAEAHAQAMGKIQYDLFITKISVDGITDAEFNMAQQAGLTFGVFDQASVETAKNMDLVAQAVANGTLKVEDMQRALDLLPKYKSIDVVINALVAMQQGGSGQAAAQAQRQVTPNARGYQHGGISSGPESGHVELLHGTEAVIPLQSGSVPVQLSGASSMAGGDNFYITLTVASPMTILNEQTARNMLLPYIIDGIRQAKAQGAIR